MHIAEEHPELTFRTMLMRRPEGLAGSAPVAASRRLITLIGTPSRPSYGPQVAKVADRLRRTLKAASI